MANFTFNVAKGRVAYYTSLVTGSTAAASPPAPAITAAGGGAALMAVLLQVGTTGAPTVAPETDAALMDKSSLANIFAAGWLEVPKVGVVSPGVANYARILLGSITTQADITNDYMTCDAADLVWPSLGTVGGASATVGPNCSISKLIICYRPLTASADTDWVPLTCHDFSVPATDGNTLTATVNNFYRAI